MLNIVKKDLYETYNQRINLHHISPWLFVKNNIIVKNTALVLLSFIEKYVHCVKRVFCIICYILLSNKNLYEKL
jgi:hypothetical protein